VTTDKWKIVVYDKATGLKTDHFIVCKIFVLCKTFAPTYVVINGF